MNDTFTTLGQAAAGVVRGLTEKQRAARKGKLTASRVACLMTGDAAKIHRLWLEMTGQSEEEDLSWVLPVQIGLATEEVNLRFAERELGEDIIDRGIFEQHNCIEWAGCTLDGVTRESETPVECKHVGGREPIETIIERYQPQMQWIMECGCWKQCILSILIGNNQHVIEWIHRDKEYAAEMVRRGQQFMSHVANRTPPVELPPVPAPVIPVRRVDMSESNSWAANSGTWIATRQAFKDYAAAEKELKALVPADAKEAYGSGIIAKRNRAGAITIKEVQ